MWTVDFKLQIFSYFVQWLTDLISREAGTGGHAPRYGRRLNDDCGRFRVGTLDDSYGMQRLTIARRSLRVVDDAERPRDDVRCHILQSEPKKRRERGKWTIPVPARVQNAKTEERLGRYGISGL